MSVGSYATLPMFLEAQVMDYAEDWLEEEESEDDYADDWVGVIILYGILALCLRVFELFCASTYEIEKVTKSDCRGHPDTKPKRNDVQHVRRQLEQDVDYNGEPARYDP
jgi:hypothetical protein